ncbi:T-complex protein 1 subunit theta [Parasteatoda tepidariorum]|uniref:T-complex protein 1 subunit theta n=1 Tax=Parasteatoda tepidariorum TaxID=114398 RepID=A0A2L2Y0H7_PARTP|nr:T-complex protein 1 subunit theta [Parasteatoda tepidariorum]
MALHVPRAPGISQMFQEGTKYFQGVEEAICRNIEACVQLADTLKTTYGPYGMNKLIINHLEKMFVTSDAAVIMNELEIQHPAAKLVVHASDMQEREVGDGTSLVIILTGALLKNAEELLRMGLAPSEIIKGYELAADKTLEILPNLMCTEVKDCSNEDDAVKGIRASLMSKAYGNEDFLARLIAKACILVKPPKSDFNVDNVRVTKILGCGIDSSTIVEGMVFKRLVEGDIQKITDAKVAVYTCPFDFAQTETKGTVLIKSANELLNYSRGEEQLLEQQVKEIVDAGINVVVSGGKFGDMALHYLNKYKVMAVRLPSKFDVRRLCKTVGAIALPKMVTPTKEETGFCNQVYVAEIGDTSVVIFKQDNKQSRISTIVIRGSTESLMDEVSRAIDDGVNNFKALSQDGKLVPGAGATEIELAKQITKYGETLPGLEQYSVKKFAEALESLPKALADNAGLKSNEVISKLYAAHQEGNRSIGVDVEGEQHVVNVEEAGILDLYITKHWAIKNAANVATTILKVDLIIMSKPAGGPKAREAGNVDPDDD